MRAGPIVRLIRLPNLFTAPVDSLAGWYLAGWTARRLGPEASLDWKVGALLAFSSVGLYLGGIVLNDLRDERIDRIERPGRPLPSGAVTRRLAWSISLSGFAAALGLAFLAAGPRGVAVAGVLTLLVAAYNVLLKDFLVGPLAMGLCRGVNVLLGASAVSGFGHGETTVWILAAALTTFVAGITCISRSEAIEGGGGWIVLGGLLEAACGGAFLALAWISWFAMAVDPAVTDLRPGRPPTPTAWRIAWLVAGTTLLALAWLPPLVAAFDSMRTFSAAAKQKAVKAGVLALPWIHAAVVTWFGGWAVGLVLIGLGLTARRIARWVHVT